MAKPEKPTGGKNGPGLVHFVRFDLRGRRLAGGAASAEERQARRRHLTSDDGMVIDELQAKTINANSLGRTGFK